MQIPSNKKDESLIDDPFAASLVEPSAEPLIDSSAEGGAELGEEGRRRRELLWRLSLGLLGAALPWGSALAAPPRIPRRRIPHLAGIEQTGTMVTGMGLSRPGVVYEVHHPFVYRDGAASPNAALAVKMIDAMMAGFTGKKSRQEAWSRFVGPGDRIGILIDPVGSGELRTRRSVIRAVILGLRAAGVEENNIVIWAQKARQLQKAGYRLNWSASGVRIAGADQFKYDKRYRYKLSGGLFASYSMLSKVVSTTCQHVINIATLEDHPVLGCHLCLANLVLASMSRSQGFLRQWGGNPTIGDIASWPVIRKRFIFHIIDGLAGTFDGGSASWRPQILLGGTDAVAVDSIGFSLIEAERRQNGRPAITGTRRYPRHIKTAAGHGAGQADVIQIQHKKIQLKS